MLYTMDEGQLLRVWSVIRCFSEIREIADPLVQSEVLIGTQLLLTAFVLELQPLSGSEGRSRGCYGIKWRAVGPCFSD